MGFEAKKRPPISLEVSDDYKPTGLVRSEPIRLECRSLLPVDINHACLSSLLLLLLVSKAVHKEASELFYS